MEVAVATVSYFGTHELSFELVLQVRALSNMLQASKSMRAYRIEDGPLIMYSNEPSVEGDRGDGAGAPVFATLPIAVFGG